MSVAMARECANCGGPISYGAAATCRPCWLECSKLTWGPNETGYTTWMHSIPNLSLRGEVAMCALRDRDRSGEAGQTAKRAGPKARARA